MLDLNVLIRIKSNSRLLRILILSYQLYKNQRIKGFWPHLYPPHNKGKNGVYLIYPFTIIIQEKDLAKSKENQTIVLILSYNHSYTKWLNRNRNLSDFYGTRDSCR